MNDKLYIKKTFSGKYPITFIRLLEIARKHNVTYSRAFNDVLKEVFGLNFEKAPEWFKEKYGVELTGNDK